jgi:hypothetical protein
MVFSHGNADYALEIIDDSLAANGALYAHA